MAEQQQETVNCGGAGRAFPRQPNGVEESLRVVKAARAEASARMADVFLCSVSDERGNGDVRAHYPLRFMRRSAAASSNRLHRLVDDPQAADLILFVESHHDASPTGLYLEHVLRHPVFRRHGEKCFIHSGLDRVIPFLPGVYPSIRRRHHRSHHTRSGAYIVEPNPFLTYTPLERIDAPLLASFVGACDRKPLRRRILELSDPAIHAEDTGAAFVGAIRSQDHDRLSDLKRHYAEQAQRSRFVLCPRGTGPSSIRLFEAMQMGRAPVILADEWVEPVGPNWPSFSIRVPERDAARLPVILREREGEAAEMGRRARAAWERFYTEDRFFDTVVDDCLGLLQLRRRPAWVTRRLNYLRLAEPSEIRRLARYGRQRTAIRRPPIQSANPSSPLPDSGHPQSATT